MNEIELRNKARLGALTDQFLSSNFYTEFLKPYLHKLREDCKELALSQVRQAGQHAADIGLETTFLSGKKSAIDDFLLELRIWSEDGKVSQAKIEKLEERK